MITVITVSGEDIKIDNSKEAIGKIKDGFESGDLFYCPECPYSSMCGEGIIVGVSWDADIGPMLWVVIEKYKPRVVACCNEQFLKLKK
jgi:hypothetical protein